MAPLGEIEHLRWRLTASATAHTICAIPECSAYEGTGFHLGNSGLYHDYHLRDRNFIVEIQHPQPWGKIEHSGVNVGLSETPGRVTGVPELGQHNDYVFGELLGLSHEDVQRLEDKKVLY